ncbi:hypothetical protein N7449_011798 [Penicillium cf. viridicatum]|uniref:Uncharacterized protein n=1 Tax=Penicillium cf. viridicatum TaxID=2972119 RepID=A0A9W9ITP5_9EURO|nr:hypothetical protein N7449_011798 [Penicillium cf. viridicatum]
MIAVTIRPAAAPRNPQDSAPEGTNGLDKNGDHRGGNDCSDSSHFSQPCRICCSRPYFDRYVVVGIVGAEEQYHKLEEAISELTKTKALLNENLLKVANAAEDLTLAIRLAQRRGA